jgi:nucleotide-binding universal stress UspA family protein
MKVLMPVYSLDDARMIVDFASNYHWPAGSSFMLLHVLGSASDEAACACAEKEADILLLQVAELVKGVVHEATVFKTVKSGDAVLEIITLASQWTANMIVMGFRVRSDIRSQLAGSVSKGVAMQSPCSLAVIHPGQMLENPADQQSDRAEHPEERSSKSTAALA